MSKWCDVEIISKSNHHKTPVWRLLCRGIPAGNGHIRHRDIIMQGQNYVPKHWLHQTSELVLKKYLTVMVRDNEIFNKMKYHLKSVDNKTGSAVKITLQSPQ